MGQEEKGSESNSNKYSLNLMQNMIYTCGVLHNIHIDNNIPLEMHMEQIPPAENPPVEGNFQLRDWLVNYCNTV